MALPRLGLDRDISEPVLRDLDRIQQFLRTSGQSAVNSRGCGLCLRKDRAL